MNNYAIILRDKKALHAGQETLGRADGAALIQGIYYLLAGLWPVLNIHSFLMVTGPKQDLWLVKTVGLLAGAIGAALVTAGLRRETTIPVVVLGGVSAAAFLVIEVFYVTHGVIPQIYLADALIEAILLGLWRSSVIPRRRLIE